MTTKTFGAAVAALALATPVAATAQAAPPAVVIAVDMRRLLTDCTACQAANTQLEAQLTAIRARAQELGTPLQTEAQSLQQAAAALQGRQPDAALQQRVQAFETRQNTAAQEIQGREQTFQRNRNYVAQQLVQRINPIITAVMRTRNANIAIDTSTALQIGASIDVTNDVLTQLNQQVPSVSVTAPPPAAAPAGQQPATTPQPQGR